MIAGFEEQTQALNDQELIIARKIISAIEGLYRKYGEDDSLITNKQLREWLANNGYKVSDARIRKIINTIRLKGWLPQLAATSKGYYICTDRQKQIDYINSLNSRVASILAVRNAFADQCNISINPLNTTQYGQKEDL